MKYLTIFTVFLVVSSSFGAPRLNKINLSTKAVIDNLLNNYGNTKLSKIINLTTISLIKQFFTQNPQHYESFKTELAAEGVHLPELQDFNWKAITQEDLNIAKLIVGDTTIKQVIDDPSILQGFLDVISADQSLVDRILLRVDQMGITLDDYIDYDSLLVTLGDTFVPMIPDFIPIGITILLFGKRDLSTFGKVDISTQAVLQILTSHPDLANKLMQFFIANGINVSTLTSGNVQSVITPQLIEKFKAFLQETPELAALLADLIKPQ